MEMTVLNIVIGIVSLCAVLFALWVLISAIVYLWQEINHSIKNMKRAMRDAWWDLEWRWNHR